MNLTRVTVSPTIMFFLLLILSSIPTPNNAQRDIFLLAGQSNMSGRGGVNASNIWDGKIPPQCRSNPSILRFSAALRWEEAREPLHVDIDVYASCGIGPGMPFANVVQPKTKSVVGLVPCAVGNTKISSWARGTDLYNTLVSRASASLKEGGNIRALLWYQGESDCVDKADANAYQGRMVKFIQDLRADLHLPSLPVIQVLLASGQGPYIDKVRKAQRGVNLPNVKNVDAKGLLVGNDFVHLTTEGQIKLGQMIANTYLRSFVNPNTVP